jgi:hypothetical protein
MHATAIREARTIKAPFSHFLPAALPFAMTCEFTLPLSAGDKAGKNAFVEKKA